MSRPPPSASLPGAEAVSPVPPADKAGPSRRRAGLAYWYAIWFGAGRSPRAPGTVGILAALPVWFGLAHLPGGLHLAFILALIVAGCYAAQRVAELTGEDDPQIVVVDESVGVLLALWVAAPTGLAGVALATLLFRLFDIYKPGPVRLVERLRPAGLGIRADDLLAGLAAGLLVRLLA
jgi:phosphatidylglycerophosphatase A